MARIEARLSAWLLVFVWLLPTPMRFPKGLRAINYSAMFASRGVLADRNVGSGTTLQFLHEFYWHSSVWIMRLEDGAPASLPLGW